MNNELKYVIKGTAIAIVLVVLASLFRFYFPTDFFIHKPTAVANHSEKDTVAIITNIAGQNLFEENCAACHQINKRDGDVLLRGVENRIKDRKLLYEWIRNPGRVIKSGNMYFNNLYKQYGVMMRGSPQLTDEQIDGIFDYIKEAEQQYNL